MTWRMSEDVRGEGDYLIRRIDVEKNSRYSIIIAEGEQLSTYSQYLHTYLDYEAIAAKLCTPGGRFLLNVKGALWKIL